MRWTYLAGPVLAAAIAVGCSSDPQPVATPDTAATDTVEDVESTTSSTTASSTAPVVTSEPPSSLAFASSRDLGRIYELATTAAGHQEPSATSESSLISSGTLVQATKARDIAGTLWVKVSGADSGASLGWVLASDLAETTQVLLSSDADLVGQFRQTRSTIEGDALTIFTEPGGTVAASTTLGEEEIAMHGGNSALTGSGETWIDVIDINSRQRLGWVPAGDFAALSKSQVRTGSNKDLDRRADADITYGAVLPTGSVTATGCNAAQITFRNNDSARGLTILFGTSNPVGREINGVQRWSAPGGTTVYVDPGETVVFTLLTNTTKLWYFTELDADGRAQSNGPDSTGIFDATAAQSFLVNAGSCRRIVTPTIDETDDTVAEPVEEETPVEESSQPTAQEESTSTTTTPPADQSSETTGG